LNPFTDANVLDHLLLLAQDQLPREPTAAESIFSNPLPLIAGFFFLYYFIVLQPERKKKREDTMMKSKLKKNDRIITFGGIHGTVVAAPAESNVLTIKIDESGTTRIKINRSAVDTVISEKTTSSEGQDG
jgi:preprotein translocase subunit YajC